MRVIHFSCVAPPDTGGIGRVASAEVTSLVERGHDAHLVSLTTHAGFRFGNVGTIHALEHFVRDADVVHLHYPFYGVAGELASLRRRGVIKHLVMTLHMDATASGLKGLFFDAHRRVFQSSILAAADGLFGSSLDYARHSSFAPYADRVIEMPFGIDETFFSPGTSTPEAFTVLFVGGMDKAHAFKGVSVLLRAIAATPLARLILVGDGNLRPSYEREAKQLGITERCEFLGRIETAKLPDVYRSASVLALPSTSGAEAFGLVLLEAQACGIPVIASDLPGVRTVLEPEQTGLLVQPGNVEALAAAIRRVQQDATWMTNARARARVFVLERFTWKKHMDKLEQVYREVTSRR